MLDRTTTPVEVSELSHGSSVGGSWGSTMRRVPGSYPPCAVLATVQPAVAVATVMAAAIAVPASRAGVCGARRMSDPPGL